MPYTSIKSTDIPVYEASVFDKVNPFISYGKYTDSAQNKTAWDCIDWVNFHKVLVVDKGKDKADDIWANYWLMGLSKSANGQGNSDAGAGYLVDSVPIDCRTFNSVFSAYVKQNGNKKLYDAVFSGFGGLVGQLESGTKDVVDNVGSTIKGTSKVLKYVVPALVITGGVILSIWAYKKFVKK